MAIDIARSDEPPEHINGKGIPNTGISPIATPIFIITCVIRQPAIPPTRYLEKYDFELLATPIIKKNNEKNEKRIITIPTKPVSSAKFAIAKSVSTSGIQLYFCTPLPKPLPNIPPVPKAIRD